MKRGARGDIDKKRLVKKPRVGVRELPPELWAEIAKYLDVKELASLQRTSQLINSSLISPESEHFVWQPLLERLHTMDARIDATVLRGRTLRETFIQSFLELQERCKVEASSLRYDYQIPEQFPLLQAFNLEKSLSLNELEALNAELDAFNALNIVPCIEEALAEQRTELVIRNLELTRIPEALFAVPEYQDFWHNLKRLDCSSNSLIYLPESIDRLQVLRELMCSQNQLQSLPESIGRLQDLEFLGCMTNQLQSLPERIGGLRALQQLICSDNALKSLPESIDKLKALKIIYCNHNELQSLPEGIGGMQALESLHCNHNELQSLPESIGGLQALRYLGCGHNKLQSLPESIGRLQTLESLHCDHNELQFLPESIGGLRALRFLYCDHNQLQSLPESIGSLQALMGLSCGNNQLQSLPETLKRRFGYRWASDTLRIQRQTYPERDFPTTWLPSFTQQRAQRGSTLQDVSELERIRYDFCSLL